MKVSLFITCMCDLLTPEVGKATVELLERFGCEVDFPPLQTCCGQPAYNSGHLKESKKAMVQIMHTFKASDYVVGPSGSCLGMIKQYPKLFAGDEKYEEAAKELAAKSYEVTQFLVRVLNVTKIDSTFTGKVTYHASCHMSRILGEREAPIQLLSSIEGLELLKLPRQQDCCGFGGTFSVDQAPISEAMVKEKVKHIHETKAEYVVSADMACLINIKGRLERENSSVKVRHITQILNH